MDSAGIEKLERLWAQTTPGTWMLWYREEFIGISPENRESRMRVVDVEYVTALLNAAPNLIERVQDLERQNAGLEARLRYLTEERDALEWEVNDIKRAIDERY